MKLRFYQEQLKNDILNAWKTTKNVLVQLPTGGGKTVLFSNILAEHSGHAIVIAHRIELVSQISLTLARYGIYHNIIAQKSSIKSIISLHYLELKKSFFHPQAKCLVAGVDTLLKLNPDQHSWIKKINLIVFDEAHHVLKENKWGKASDLFPGSFMLGLSATPIRADGKGLGKYADGIMDIIITGPPIRELIQDGFLTDFKVYVPPSDLDLSDVNISASGDYSPPKLRKAVHRSHITGDVVSHYKKFAEGKLGITFAVDIQSAEEITKEFRNQGINAEVISSRTPDLLRSRLMMRFRKREILQLVNVDLLGEGVDIPAIEVISMVRPTQSYAVYAQQFGRALRPMENKTHAIIIDHVGNVMRHGVPDAIRVWSLDRRERKLRTGALDAIPLKTCLKCFSVFEALKKQCPHCGEKIVPPTRSAPEFVEGDLIELDAKVLAKLRGEVDRIDSAPKIPRHLPAYVQHSIIKKHQERQAHQSDLRKSISLWAGYFKNIKNYDDSEIYRNFYFNFGIDILTAQTLNAKEAEQLNEKIQGYLNEKNIEERLI